MEAVAALGVAGNTIQFLDFATRLCATSIEIYQNADGTTAANTQAEALLLNFIETVDEISIDLGQYFGALGISSTQAHTQGNTQVNHIIADCQAIAKDLLHKYDALKSNNKPGKLKSFKNGMRCLWRKNELEELQSRLKKNRDELTWRILISLRGSMNLQAARQEDQFRDVQDALIAKMTDVLRSEISSIPQWTATLEQILQHLQAGVLSAANPIVPQSTQLAHLTQLQTANAVTVDLANEDATNYAAKLASNEEARWKSLSFQIMDDREDQIADAEMKTFDWILHPPQKNHSAWSNFLEWINSNQSTYWISGKAGSGKSTLMKYLANHAEVRRALQTWARDMPLVVASFYFWYHGNVLQKTQEGLLRSLLYQCLEDHRELIPVVLAEASGMPLEEVANSWTLHMLKKAFTRLMEQEVVPLRICLLVDGLDEYAGDHAEIINIFRHAAKYTHVKICISSRPLIIFERAFKDHPGLSLQDLTFNDIQIYVKSKFREDERFQELESHGPGLGRELALQVVSKASGVFLWVRLVVHSLLQGIQNYDRGVDLKRRIEELPQDLTDLYGHMINQVKPTWYLEEGYKLLLVVRAAIRPLTVLQLAFMGLGTVVVSGDLAYLTAEKQNALCRSMKGRTKSRCLGLLEVVETAEARGNSAHVQFLHKSVAEFIGTPEMMSRMQDCLDDFTSFHPETEIMRAISIELKTIHGLKIKEQIGNRGKITREEWYDRICCLRDDVLAYADRIHLRDPATTTSLMMEVDRILVGLWDRRMFEKPEYYTGKGHWSSPMAVFDCSRRRMCYLPKGAPYIDLIKASSMKTRTQEHSSDLVQNPLAELEAAIYVALQLGISYIHREEYPINKSKRTARVQRDRRYSSWERAEIHYGAALVLRPTSLELQASRDPTLVLTLINRGGDIINSENTLARIRFQMLWYGRDNKLSQDPHAVTKRRVDETGGPRLQIEGLRNPKIGDKPDALCTFTAYQRLRENYFRRLLFSYEVTNSFLGVVYKFEKEPSGLNAWSRYDWTHITYLYGLPLFLGQDSSTYPLFFGPDSSTYRNTPTTLANSLTWYFDCGSGSRHPLLNQLDDFPSWSWVKHKAGSQSHDLDTPEFLLSSEDATHQEDIRFFAVRRAAEHVDVEDVEDFAKNRKNCNGLENFTKRLVVHSWAVKCRLSAHSTAREDCSSDTHKLSGFAEGTFFPDHLKQNLDIDIIAIHLGTLNHGSLEHSDHGQTVLLIVEEISGSKYRRIGVYRTTTLPLVKDGGVQAHLESVRPEGGWEKMWLEIE